MLCGKEKSLIVIIAKKTFIYRFFNNYSNDIFKQKIRAPHAVPTLVCQWPSFYLRI